MPSPGEGFAPRARWLFAMLVLPVIELVSPAYAQIPPGITLEQISAVGGRPVAIRNAGDGSGRLFIVRQEGDVLIYDSRADVVMAAPFLDISPLVDDSENEQGLLGLAFHPDYRTNGYFYVNYTRNLQPTSKDRTVIARYRVSASNPDRADANSAVVLLEVEQDFQNHNGGDMHFGPDGYLYIGMGDGGGSGDPNDRAQDLQALVGKILRIDVDGGAGTQTTGLCGLNRSLYGVPTGNPFAGVAGACGEIWAYGLRNPWRWSFDRSTGDMFIGDVGQRDVEEISFQPAGVGGLNFGWRCREGDQPFNNNPTCTGPLVEPILTYTHASGCSVTGGYRYRGAYGPLNGTYVYADFCSGRIWFASESTAGNWSSVEWMNTGLNISAFGEDENGELYLADLSGAVYGVSAPSGELIVDNQDANTTRTGTWSVSSGANPWAGQSRYNNAGSTFRWLPEVPVGGDYEVSVWWTFHPNRSNAVPYRIAHADGVTEVIVNQHSASLGGQWNVLGTFSFDADGGGYIEVSSENGQASADAVRLAPATSGIVVVDNKDTNTAKIGTWLVSSGADPWAGQSRYNNAGNTFRWLPEIPVSGDFDVYAWWTFHPNRSRSVPYRIGHADGVTERIVDQHDRSLGGRWNLLGTFNLDAGNSNYVEVSSENGQASADAVRFVPR